MHYPLVYDPKNAVNHEPLVRFSAFSGIVEKDDLSGEPVYLTIKAEKRDYSTSAEEKKTMPSPIYYNMPGSAEISVEYKDNPIIRKSLPIAQFGISVALSQDLFRKSAPQIEFDPKTGAIKSISK